MMNRPTFANPNILFHPAEKRPGLIPSFSNPEWRDTTPAREKIRNLIIDHKVKVVTMSWRIPLYYAFTDKIIMPQMQFFRDPDDFYAILLHELGHWTGHKSRLDRDWALGAIIPGTAKNIQEELTAEKTAMHLAEKFDLPINHGRESFVEFITMIGNVKHGRDRTQGIVRRADQASREAIRYLENETAMETIQ